MCELKNVRICGCENLKIAQWLKAAFSQLYQNRTPSVSITNYFVYCASLLHCKSLTFNSGILLGNIVGDKAV
jgi:hypothetical protein